MHNVLRYELIPSWISLHFIYFSLDVTKQLGRIFDYILSSFGGGGLHTLTWSHQLFCFYSQIFLPLSLKNMLRWIFGSTPFLILDIFIVYIFFFNMRFIFIWFIWYKLPYAISILISWLNYIKKNIMNAKILMIRKSAITFLRYYNKIPSINFIKLRLFVVNDKYFL